MKKPSKIKCVSAKKAWIMFSNFVAITLFGVVYCKSRQRADEINKLEEIQHFNIKAKACISKRIL